jgi:hypothetical protein
VVRAGNDAASLAAAADELSFRTLELARIRAETVETCRLSMLRELRAELAYRQTLCRLRVERLARRLLTAASALEQRQTQPR